MYCTIIGEVSKRAEEASVTAATGYPAWYSQLHPLVTLMLSEGCRRERQPKLLRRACRMLLEDPRGEVKAPFWQLLARLYLGEVSRRGSAAQRQHFEWVQLRAWQCRAEDEADCDYLLRRIRLQELDKKVITREENIELAQLIKELIGTGDFAAPGMVSRIWQRPDGHKIINTRLTYYHLQDRAERLPCFFSPAGWAKMEEAHRERKK